MASIADRVRETTTTTGTGTVSLGGATTGFQAFSSAFTSGTVVYYCITDGTNWEVGSGAVTTGTPWALARSTVLASSNAGSLVSFGAGSKDVFCTLPAGVAEVVANKDASGGYAGLTLFKINFKNAANTFTSFFTNSNTAARTYTFQDRDGTMADNTDIAGRQALSSILTEVAASATGTGAGTLDLVRNSELGSAAYADVSQIASFIQAGGVGASLVTSTTVTYTVLPTDTDLIANYAGTMTLTLPDAAIYPNRRLTIRTITANTVVSAASNVVPAAGGAAGTAILSATAGKWATLMSDGTNWQIQAQG